MILKPNQISTHYVFFKRNASTCVGIGYINGVCRINSYISKYTYECLSESIYSLTIPADNMTKDEQNSRWHCESVVIIPVTEVQVSYLKLQVRYISNYQNTCFVLKILNRVLFYFFFLMFYYIYIYQNNKFIYNKQT